MNDFFDIKRHPPSLIPRTSPFAPMLLFLCGDLMTGRGIDQVLPHPCEPELHEPYVSDARDYVRLAEMKHGEVPAPVTFAYVWGDALQVLEAFAPDVRLVNLETSVTSSDDHWESKGIHYRMGPDNVPVLTSAAIDVCNLANNHVLDWGYAGLRDTLASLHVAGIKTTGAGPDVDRARTPAILDRGTYGRVLVFGVAAPDCGVPDEWAASLNQPGINLLSDYGDSEILRLAKQIRAVKLPGDVVVLSIHWGSNWGYEIPPEHEEFAHRMIDEGGVDLIHGHSSHHVKAFEVYNGKLILYGCGDLLTDYEGIGGHEEFRPDLALMYFPLLRPSDGRLEQLRMVPVRVKNLQLQRATRTEARWLAERLNGELRHYALDVKLTGENTLELSPPPAP